MNMALARAENALPQMSTPEAKSELICYLNKLATEKGLSGISTDIMEMGGYAFNFLTGGSVPINQAMSFGNMFESSFNEMIGGITAMNPFSPVLRTLALKWPVIIPRMILCRRLPSRTSPLYMN